MGQSCSSCKSVQHGYEFKREDSPDPVMYDVMRKSLEVTTETIRKRNAIGQHHLLYKNLSKQSSPVAGSSPGSTMSAPASCPTRLVVRRGSMRNDEEGKHIYAIRYPEDIKDLFVSEQAMATTPTFGQEQCPPRRPMHAAIRPSAKKELPKIEGETFARENLQQNPVQKVVDWVTVSEEHSIFIADVGLIPEDCDQIVAATEHVCRGQYAAYTYAKQTLGCREYPTLVRACFPPVHTVVHAIGEKFNESRRLQLDDREPHMVKYDTTKKERQKLDMHTDKSEWTFLIALSNGCGVDYEGGGTYFECIDAVIHLQRGHALIFPGKLRHCGKKIIGGLRFLLVGFLVDKSTNKEKLANKENDEISADGEVDDAESRDDTDASVDQDNYSDTPMSKCIDLQC
ncbi:unnamed protein product [Cylindrotheca closterium]|uniref:Fe2OG dioxygenase domain-containing protein n=1 Tax=Cylindrotheca closterium TaxID=2856 RepID=A0AAD2FWL0_9STRA|nr:unnamed protein product [Cylindrotheca closterium]